MPDESMMSACSVWARVRVTAVPADAGRQPQTIEVGVKACSIPDPQDALAAWSVELHTESRAPASGGGGQDLGPKETTALPKATFYAEAVFGSEAALTHVKGRCLTSSGERFTKAVKLPEALSFMPGDLARIEIFVYMDSDGPIPQPSVEVFQEPELERVAAPPPALGSPRFGLGSRMPTRPIGLFY